MDKNTFDKAVLLNQNIERLEAELLICKEHRFRFSVVSGHRTKSDPIGVEIIFEYPLLRIVNKYREDCIKALNQKIDELKKEFNNL